MGGKSFCLVHLFYCMTCSILKGNSVKPVTDRLESWAALQGGQQRVGKLDEIINIRLHTSRTNRIFQEDKKREKQG